MLSPYARLLVLLDFDGTVTTHECNELMLQRFTGDQWRDHEDALHRGELTHAECLRRQVALLTAPRDAVVSAMLDAAEPALGLAEALAEWSAGGARLVVVSAGFREAIEALWRREDLPPATIVASELSDGPPYRIAYNRELGDCPICGPGGCKGSVVRSLRRPEDVVAVFGDGHADLCMARSADVVFAHGSLAALCRDEGIAYHDLDYRAALPVIRAALPT